MKLIPITKKKTAMKKSSRRRTPYLMLVVLTLSLLIYRGCGSPSVHQDQKYVEVSLAELLANPLLFDGETLLITDCYLEGGFYLYSRGIYQLRPSDYQGFQLIFTSNLLPYERGSEVEMFCLAKVILDTDAGYVLLLREINTKAADRPGKSPAQQVT